MAMKWKDKAGEHLHFFKEIELQNGDLQIMAAHIRNTLPPIVLNNALFTGDATGQNRNIGNLDAISNWKTMMKLLKISPSRLKLPSANPSVAGMRNLINLLLATHPDLKIDVSMKKTIFEAEYTEADEEGKIIKKNRNKEEQRADFLDAFRYLVYNFHSDWIKKAGLYMKQQ